MGYLNNKEKTEDTIDDDGWLHSGDLLQQDPEGWFSVVGRRVVSNYPHQLNWVPGANIKIVKC